MSVEEHALSSFRAHLTAYDLLGYLAPGASFLLCILGFEHLAREVSASSVAVIHTPILSLFGDGFSSIARKDSWAVEFLVVLSCAGLAYVAGHVIASLSALALDRAYVEKGHGYPLQSLLGKVSMSGTSKVSADFARAAFMILNLWLLAGYLSLPNAPLANQFLPRPLTDFFPNALSPITFLFFRRVLGWLLLLLVAAKLALSPQWARHQGQSAWIYETFIGSCVVLVATSLIKTAAYPARGVTGFFSNYLHTRSPLDEETVRAYKDRLGKLLRLEPKWTSSSPYWFTVIPVRASGPAISESADNWLRLYSFARNLGTAFYLAFVYAYVWWLNFGTAIQFRSQADRDVLFLLPLALFSAAFVMMLRFYYLYADYYTRYLVRAFVYSTCDLAGTPIIASSEPFHSRTPAEPTR